jgi:hypothetical protein
MITFSGIVSAQATPGEDVTITITSPDSSIRNLLTATDVVGGYSAMAEFAAGIGYQAQAIITEDALYQEAMSEVVTFDVSKAARTITLNIS